MNLRHACATRPKADRHVDARSLPRAQGLARVAAALWLGLSPALVVASDFGEPIEWLFGIYLAGVALVTVVSLIVMAAGCLSGAYRDKPLAVWHASIATALYVGTAIFGMVAFGGPGDILGLLLILAVLIWLSIMVPMKAHEMQLANLPASARSRNREKLLKDYLLDPKQGPRVDYGLSPEQFVAMYQRKLDALTEAAIPALEALLRMPVGPGVESAHLEVFHGEAGDAPAVWIHWRGRQNRVDPANTSIFPGRSLELKLGLESLAEIDERYFSADTGFPGVQLSIGPLSRWLSESWWRAGGWRYPLPATLGFHDLGAEGWVLLSKGGDASLGNGQTGGAPPTGERL